jgi:hypothetical protein
MASLTRGTTFVDGVANDVTAAKLSALVDNATPTSGFIQDRTAETITATNDTLLIGDASDSNNLKRITVANFAQTLPTAKVTTGTIETGTFGTTTSTAATITTGTITNLNSTTGTVATLNSTTGTITTGVIPTLTSITKITSGTGTAAAPAISPTGDTNTGIFFPAADTIAFSDGGAESVRIDSSGNVGIGTTSPAYQLDVNGEIASQSNAPAIILSKTNNAANNKTIWNTIDASGNMIWSARNDAGAGGGNSFSLIRSAEQINSIEAQSSGTTWFKIDNSATSVGIGTDSPSGKLDVYDATSSILNVLGNSTVQAVVYKGSSDTAAPILTLRKSRGSVESPTAVATGDQIGNINFQAFGGTNNRGVCRIISNIEAYVSDSNISSNLTFLTSSAGGVTATERMRIDASGNVSIGTATALSRLHVHGDLTMSNATVSTTAATGGLTLPATAAGYLTVSINGTSRKIPYYA